MKKTLQGLCALSICIFAVTTLTASATQVMELAILNTPVETETQTVILEEFGYQSMAESNVFRQYLKVETPVNRISMGGDLEFLALEDQVTVTVNVLTDLDGDGYYEWLNSSYGSAQLVLTGTGALTADGMDNQQMQMGERRTLSAQELLHWGLIVEQDRMADGDTPLFGLNLLDSGDILYCLSVMEEDGDSQSYYFQLDRNLDTTTPANQLGAGAFSDVPTWAWYWDEVDWAVRAGMMNGVTATTFVPEQDATRAALVQALYLWADAPQVELVAFSDVAEGDWYADAVSWGYAMGLVSGYSDGSFRPNASLTREQLAVIVHEAVQLGGIDLGGGVDLEQYTDGDQVASWAKDALAWAVGVGVLDETDGGLLTPQGTVSRATLASVLMMVDGLSI